MTFKECPIDLPNHALIGRVVSVQAIIFTHDPEKEKPDPAYVDKIRLVYDDGRAIILMPCGYEAEGISVEVVDGKKGE